MVLTKLQYVTTRQWEHWFAVSRYHEVMYWIRIGSRTEKKNRTTLKKLQTPNLRQIFLRPPTCLVTCNLTNDHFLNCLTAVSICAYLTAGITVQTSVFSCHEPKYKQPQIPQKLICAQAQPILSHCRGSPGTARSTWAASLLLRLMTTICCSSALMHCTF